MTMVTLAKKTLKVPRRRALKLLQERIDIGERLHRMALGPWEHGKEGDVGGQWILWYGAVQAILREIYPTSEEEDAVRHAEAAANSWPTRIELAVDRLRDLKASVRLSDEPAATTTLVRILLERPAFRMLIEAL